MFYLSTTCLCALPCLKNRKRNWCHRQSRHDIYALDNCDDVAQAKAAVAAPQVSKKRKNIAITDGFESGCMFISILKC